MGEELCVSVCGCATERVSVRLCICVCECVVTTSARHELCRGDIKVNTACRMLQRLGRQQMALWQMESLSGKKNGSSRASETPPIILAKTHTRTHTHASLHLHMSAICICICVCTYMHTHTHTDVLVHCHISAICICLCARARARAHPHTPPLLSELGWRAVTFPCSEGSLAV